MRVAIHSNAPWASTGYGVQTELLMHALRAQGHDVAVVASYGLHGAAMQIGEIVVYPGGAAPFAEDVLAAHATDFRADLVVSLLDVWPFTGNEFSGLRWCPWFPLDCAPMPDPIRKPLGRSWQPIAMSRFGQRAAEAKGLDCRYAPLAFDPDVYAPMPKAEAREQLGWPRDRFVVGVVAANAGDLDRKAFVPQLHAWATFHAHHPDALLYLHTDVTGGHRGFDLRPLLAHLELEEGRDYLALPAYARTLGGLEKAKMRRTYAGMDALLSVSLGEGFGVPIVEAQACGRPVLVGDWTAMAEVTRSGWKLPVEGSEPAWHPIGAEMRCARVGALVELLETAYRDAATFAPDAVAAGVAEYAVGRVAEEHWRPLLAEFTERITAGARYEAAALAGVD